MKIKKIFYLKNVYFFIFILIITILFRFISFPGTPAGVMQDEADAGYEAYSIMTHGTDKWGYKYPPYFISWGSGQNVLESYLEIPFIKVFGLSVFSIRLLPAILGVLSVIILFFLVKKTVDIETALLSSFILAIMPWAVMSSRWALESNLLPFFILFGLFTFTYSISTKYKQYLIPFSLIPFALALYAYIVSIVIIPPLIILLFMYFYKNIKNNKLLYLLSLILFLIVASPIIIFLIDNNIIHHISHKLNLLPFSQPMLLMSRLDQVSSNNNFLYNIRFFMSGFVDGLIWDNMDGYIPLAITYIPLVIIGGVFTLIKKNNNGKIFLFWVISSIPIMFIATLNTNRANSFMIPFIALTSYAIVNISNRLNNKEKYSMIIIYLLLISFYSLVFFHDYLKNYNTTDQWVFNVNFDKALADAQKIAGNKLDIYISNDVALNYVYTLFYTRADSLDFQRNTVYAPVGPIIRVENYRKYYFDPYNPDLPKQKKYVYILKGGVTIPCVNVKKENIYDIGLFHVGICYPNIKI